MGKIKFEDEGHKLLRQRMREYRARRKIRKEIWNADYVVVKAK